MDSSIKVERLEDVLRVTLDNPSRRNAIGTEALNSLDRLADKIAADNKIRAVIVTGACARISTTAFWRSTTIPPNAP